MKTCNLLFCGFAGVLTSGCSLKMAGPPAATANVPSLTESTELTVPLPAQTPFDKNPKAKAAMNALWEALATPLDRLQSESSKDESSKT